MKNTPAKKLTGDELTNHLKQLEDEIKNDLETNPKYKEFFARYKDISVKSFINYYSRKKAWFITFGDEHQRQVEKTDIKYIDAAMKVFWYIPQVHLFELQCQWRAEQIQLPGVECTFDFYVLGEEIENVTFLPKVSQEDVDLLTEFIMSEEFDPQFLDYYINQDYESLKQEYGEGDFDNPWYEFYFHRTGKNYLFQLPDIRGDKEDFYRDLVRKEKQKGKKEQIYKPDLRPEIDTLDKNFIKTFIKNFEDPQMLLLYETCEKYKNHFPDDDVMMAIHNLQEADEIMPIDEHSDWREAIIKASQNYQRKKISEALQGVYDDYLLRLDMGIDFKPFEEADRKIYKGMVETVKKTILEGRVLNNEPADFDF